MNWTAVTYEISPQKFTLSVNEIEPVHLFFSYVEQRSFIDFNDWVCRRWRSKSSIYEIEYFFLDFKCRPLKNMCKPITNLKHKKWKFSGCVTSVCFFEAFSELYSSTWLYVVAPTAPAKLGLVRMRTSGIVIRRRSSTAPASPWTPGTRRSSSPSASCSPPACWWRRGCWSECRGCRWCERQIWRPTSRVTPASGFTTS